MKTLLKVESYKWIYITYTANGARGYYEVYRLLTALGTICILWVRLPKHLSTQHQKSTRRQVITLLHLVTEDKINKIQIQRESHWDKNFFIFIEWSFESAIKTKYSRCPSPKMSTWSSTQFCPWTLLYSCFHFKECTILTRTLLKAAHYSAASRSSALSPWRQRKCSEYILKPNSLQWQMPLGQWDQSIYLVVNLVVLAKLMTFYYFNHSSLGTPGPMRT